MKNLDGNDLWDFLCSGGKDSKPNSTRAISKAEKRKRKKENAAAAFRRVKEELHETYEALDLWTPVAIVQVFYKTTCNHCGSKAVQPELHLSSKPLIRLRHKRSGETREARKSWSEVPKNLPTILTYLEAETTHCLVCVEPNVPCEPNDFNPQLELNLCQ